MKYCLSAALPLPALCMTLALLLALLVPAGAHGQSNTSGSVVGSVVDAQHRAISGARLVARNTATGAERIAATDASGGFRLAALDPGSYSVQIEAPGFAPLRIESLTVEVGRDTPIAPVLAVGSPKQTVVVNGEPSRADTTSTAVATNIGQAQLDGLPSNGRRWSNFALQTEGVTPDQNGFGLLNFRGISGLLNNNTVDGVDNNQAFFSEERGRTRVGYSTTQAAVREFQVNTSNYSAEYGRAAGGVVNTVTRSGGNTLHGQIFFYNRDQSWGATNPFTTLTQRQPDGSFVTRPFKPQDTRRQWGAAVGGPIRRERLFWFFAYDQYRRDFPGVARAGDPEKLFAAPSQSTLQSLATRTGVNVTQALASYNDVLNGLASLLGSVPRSGNQTIFFPKVDWQVDDRNHVAVQYNRMRWKSPGGVQTGASEQRGASSFGNDFVRDDWVVANWSLFLTANLLNELRYQYGRDFEAEFSQPPSLFEQMFAQNYYGAAPQIALLSGSSGFTFGKPAFLDRAAYPDERRQQIVETLTWVHGRHLIKAGYDLNHVNDYSNNLYNGGGSYSYSSLLDFVTDVVAPSHCAASGDGAGSLPCYNYFSQALGPQIFEFSTVDYAGFVTDEWKPLHRLTLSAGLRYEFELLPETNRRLVNPDIPQTAKLPRDGNNLAPRLGVAWDVFGRGRTVLRAGYGIYYGRIINSTAFAALTGTGAPNAQRSFYFKPVDTGAPLFPYVLTPQSPLASVPSAYYFDRHFQNPQVHEAELSLEQYAGRGTSITLSYLVSLGRELPSFIDTNIDLTDVQTIDYEIDDASGKGPLQGTYSSKLFTKRLNPNYQQITAIMSRTNSRYQAGVVRVSHRMKKVFDLHASYTYAHAADFNQNESTFADNNDVLDPTDFRMEYGNSNFDVRQRATGSAIVRAPWKLRGAAGYALNGFALAPIAEVRTGLPYNMRTSGSVPSCRYQQYTTPACDETDYLTAPATLSGLGASINGSGGDNRIPAVGRNSFHYAPVSNFDLRLTKRTPIGERCQLELIAEAFNLLNRQNVTATDTLGYLIDAPSSHGGPARLTWQTGFGTVTNANSNTLYRERQVQLAMRLSF